MKNSESITQRRTRRMSSRSMILRKMRKNELQDYDPEEENLTHRVYMTLRGRKKTTSAMLPRLI